MTHLTVRALMILTLGLSACVVPLWASAGAVEIRESGLFIDGEAQPQLYGAELQYFRLRGGQGRNIPRERVIALWDKALEHMKSARMNMLSFYIPWDFHEYKEGHFDFEGTADEDGDGNPDYPSRDVKTFIHMAVEKGFTRLMARPGPYINAEWGFLGFGAIPLWFHEKYPDSHMQNAKGYRAPLYDYFNPDLRRHTELWFKAVHENVLRSHIGPGKPISFLQLDNETNYMWQTIYNLDYGPRAIRRYQNFLKDRHGSLDKINTAHGRDWNSLADIKAPVVFGHNRAEDQDWYRFADHTMFSYLQFIRKTWESLGVREPEVLFTLAESYNAPQNGVLPNYQYRNDPTTGLLTVNLYPKVFDTPERPLHNSPFKADHDVKAATEATTRYLGRKANFAMGPEIQGGWWRGTEVTAESRRQTYLTTLGHGLKALMIYYFTEGQNWQNDWILERVTSYYRKLRNTDRYRAASESLPKEFWQELQETFNREQMVGYDVRSIMENGPFMKRDLEFDAPLTKDAEPRPHFEVLVEIGEKIMKDHGTWLGGAFALEDRACLIKDSRTHVPSVHANLDSILMHGEWTGALVGTFEQLGVNPRIVHWDLQGHSALNNCQVVVVQDNGHLDLTLLAKLKTMAQQGATVVSLFGSKVAHAFAAPFTVTERASVSGNIQVKTSTGGDITVPGSTLFKVEQDEPRPCMELVTYESDTLGIDCPMGKGRFVYIGASVHGLINSSGYVSLSDIAARSGLFRRILGPHFRSNLSLDGEQPVAAFGRTHADGKIWITLKNGQNKKTRSVLKLNRALANRNYAVTNLFTGKELKLTGQELKNGIAIELAPFGSTVYTVAEDWFFPWGP